jgi:hypothetical protein
MSRAFDGAGPEFHGPTARAAIFLLVAVIVGVVFLWLGLSWALNTWAGADPSSIPSIGVNGPQI